MSQDPLLNKLWSQENVWIEPREQQMLTEKHGIHFMERIVKHRNIPPRTEYLIEWA